MAIESPVVDYPEHPNVLVVGGTSGLGLETARLVYEAGGTPIVVGRHDPSEHFTDFRPFDFASDNLDRRTEEFVSGLEHIDTMVWTPGMFLDGRITETSREDVRTMLNIGEGLVWMSQQLLSQQHEAVDETRSDQIPESEKLELVTVTSTSGYVPRLREPSYNYVKAGSTLYSEAMSKDERVRNVLVAAPSGMKTDFFKKVDPNWPTETFMPPEAVAERIMMLREYIREHGLPFLEAKILGAHQDLPERIEVVKPIEIATRLFRTY